MKYSACLLPLALIAAPVAAQTAQTAQTGQSVQAGQSAQDTAQRALAQAPVWDGHNDVPYALRALYRNVIGAFDFNDTSAAAPDHPAGRAMHTDIPRLRQGKVGAQFWSVYVPAYLVGAQAVQTTLEQIDVTKRLIARYPADLSLAVTADQVESAMAQGKIASLIGMEGGHSVNSSLAVLRQMYALGARYMTLTHSKNTPWADSATDTPEHDGLTDFGKDLVREMNRMGMLVDLSHVSEKTMHDALDVARAPVMFSHSGVRGISGHACNVPDNVLRRLPNNGGLVMVAAYPTFVSEQVRQYIGRRAAEAARQDSLWPGSPEQAASGLALWDKAHPMPQAQLSEMADHIDRIRAVAGINHIGIGGDFDGIPITVAGMDDVSAYPALFTELARRGYSQSDLEKIASRNMMRVMRSAELYAASQIGQPPIETPVAARK